MKECAYCGKNLNGVCLVYDGHAFPVCTVGCLVMIAAVMSKVLDDGMLIEATPRQHQAMMGMYGDTPTA